MADFLAMDAQISVRNFDVQLELRPDEIVALVGPNGAGKSTLLNLIAGALQPTSGTVTFRDRVLSGPGVHVPPHRRHFSLVAQQALLFPHLNVLDNVAFGPRSRGSSKADARERAMKELASTAVDNLAERRRTQLSGGQAQRVSIARALAIDPDILLLDEPFASLDVSVTPELRRLLRDRLRGQAAVITTHDLLDVVTLADRLIVCEGGRIVADGPVAEVCNSPTTAFLAEFVGVNLVTGTAEGADALRIGDQIVVGTAADLRAGQAGRAIIAPNAVALHLETPGGSPRNALRAEVESIESLGSVVAVTVILGGQRLRADLTPAAVAELGLVPGMAVIVVVKATQVQLFPHT